MFVTLEGIEGSGKSTLARGLAERMLAAGRRVLITREPGGCELGRHLRALLLHAEQRINPRAELFLFLADRAQHVAEIIRPALEAGQVVLCDRYVDSTLAYQGYGRGLSMVPAIAPGTASAMNADPAHAVAHLRELCALATDGLCPDVTLLLDVDVQRGLDRARFRQQADGNGTTEGRFEALPTDFHHRVRHGFLELARQEPQRWVVIDAAPGPEQVLEQCWQALTAREVRA